MKIGIIGSGEMAFGISRNILEKIDNVTLCLYSTDKNLKERFENLDFFKNIVHKSESILYSSSLKDLLSTDIIIESTYEDYETK